jgi:hypothetical protein
MTGKTISEKILSLKSRTDARADDLVVCDVDCALGTDGSTPTALDSAQLIAYVEDGLYLRPAGRANALAGRLAEAMAAVPSVDLLAPVEANLMFLSMPPAMIDALLAAGIKLGRRSDRIIRLGPVAAG